MAGQERNMEGSEEQKQKAAREAKAQGKKPSEMGATTGASKQRKEASRNASHQEKLDRLTKLNGKDFTKQYDDMQVSAHKDAVSLFERYGKEGDNAALKAFAAKTLQHLQQHLMMAQDLNK